MKRRNKKHSEPENTINLQDNGGVRIRLTQPLQANIHNMFSFGNVRGVRIEVSKNHIIGVIFDCDRTLETFYKFNGLSGLPDVKQIVKKIEESAT